MHFASARHRPPPPLRHGGGGGRGDRCGRPPCCWRRPPRGRCRPPPSPDRAGLRRAADTSGRHDDVGRPKIISAADGDGDAGNFRGAAADGGAPVASRPPATATIAGGAAAPPFAPPPPRRHAAPYSAWWPTPPCAVRSLRSRHACLGRSLPPRPPHRRSFCRPPPHHCVLRWPRRPWRRPPRRRRPLPRLPPPRTHCPALATRVAMSDACRSHAALCTGDDPPAHGAGAGACATTAPVGVGGSATADAGAAAGGVGGGRAAADARDATTCATATAPGVCPAARSTTWLSAPLVDQPSLIRGFGIRHFWLHSDIIHIPSHSLWIEYLTRPYSRYALEWHGCATK